MTKNKKNIVKFKIYNLIILKKIVMKKIKLITVKYLK